MQGTVAQIIALTVHGNASLQQGRAFDGAEFGRQNSTFKFCESVDFKECVPGIWARKERFFAANPHDWFERLRNDGVLNLRMSYEPSDGKRVADWMLVGLIGGGGKWLIQSREPSRSDFWEARWQLGNRDRTDKKIWRVSYIRALTKKHPTHAPFEDLDRLRLELKQCLEEIAQFSRSQNLEWFTKAFESGISRLESPDPLAETYHSDIAPFGFLSLAANQLLGAAQAAWVFGGMGSWNDQGFEGQTRALYEQLSAKLYRLLNKAIVAASNSSTPDRK